MNDCIYLHVCINIYAHSDTYVCMCIQVYTYVCVYGNVYMDAGRLTQVNIWEWT